MQELMHQIRDLEPVFESKTGVQFGFTGRPRVSDLSEALLKALVPETGGGGQRHAPGAGRGRKRGWPAPAQSVSRRP